MLKIEKFTYLFLFALIFIHSYFCQKHFRKHTNVQYTVLRKINWFFNYIYKGNELKILHTKHIKQHQIYKINVVIIQTVSAVFNFKLYWKMRAKMTITRQSTQRIFKFTLTKSSVNYHCTYFWHACVLPAGLWTDIYYNKLTVYLKSCHK